MVKLHNVEPSGGVRDEGGTRSVCGVPDQITDFDSKTRRPAEPGGGISPTSRA